MAENVGQLNLDTAPQQSTASRWGRLMLNKVPEITIFFWLIKVLCTTVGETAADLLNETLNLGLSGTSVVMGVMLIIVLFFQFRARRYIPSVYWLAVVLLSIVGTLITDNLVDTYEVPLETTTIIFGVALIVTFVAWYASEGTLSIHTIYTTRREAFYWLAILFTFALGTAAGDLVAERYELGYLTSALIFGALIAAVTIAHYAFGLDAVLTFWIAYILTRPLGASLGDFLSQPVDDGGLGLRDDHDQRDLPGRNPHPGFLPCGDKGRRASTRGRGRSARSSGLRGPSGKFMVIRSSDDANSTWGGTASAVPPRLMRICRMNQLDSTITEKS